jgi:hypothetical protein
MRTTIPSSTAAPTTAPTAAPSGLRLSLPFMVPLGLNDEDLTIYLSRSQQVAAITNTIPSELPVWDQTKPLTEAVLRTFADHGARQFTTDPHGLIFSQIRDHDINYPMVRVNDTMRRVTAADLLAEQFTSEEMDSEMFLSALTGAPAFFRMPGDGVFSRIARLNTMSPVSVRVVVFLDDPCMVQFQPEYDY